MAQKSGVRLKLGLFVAGLVLIEFLLILMLVSSNQVVGYNLSERQAVASEMGGDSEARIAGVTNFLFNSTLVKPGFYDAFNQFLFSGGGEDYVRHSTAPLYTDNRIHTFWGILYAIYYRCAVIAAWIPPLAPLIIAIFIDARQGRKVRRWRFSYVSPMTRAWAARARVGVSCLLIIAILLPTHVPSMIYPILIAGMLISYWVSITHLQKQI